MARSCSNNSIVSLKEIPFLRRSKDAQMATKQLGPPRPSLNIKQVCGKAGRSYNRGFSRRWYEQKSWLAGCEESGSLFCFPCLLFHPKGASTAHTSWTKAGVTDMRHLAEKVKRHEATAIHMDSCFKLSTFGLVNLVSELDGNYRLAVRRHNDEVSRNRHLLMRLIDYVKFCGASDFASRRGNDEPGDDAFNNNAAAFRGQVDSVTTLDEVFEKHLKTATVFNGSSKSVQHELLDSMHAVVMSRITDDVTAARFVAVQADETADVSTQTQLVLVVRYVDARHALQERFLEFLPVVDSTADAVAAVLVERLRRLLPGALKEKLIAQAYDGASVMKGEEAGVQQQVREHFQNAHQGHSYAHRLDLIMQQATSHVPAVKVFFSGLGGISSFFGRSPKRTSGLDEAVASRLPRASPKSWNFTSRTLNTVHENLEDFVRCFDTIRSSYSFDGSTMREASDHLRMLQDEEFQFFLQLFNKIMPHVDLLYKNLQKKDIDEAFIAQALQTFMSNIEAIRQWSKQPKQEPTENPTRSRMGDEEKQRLWEIICDTILTHARERFSFTDHLVSATLLQADMFECYCRTFPTDALNATAMAYPMLNKNKLKTELSLVYENPEFRRCCSVLALYQVLMRYDLQDTFSEMVALMNILITTPMTTAEDERCFSTLKRIKTFLRNAEGQERLNALAMLSIERELVLSIPDFNEKVIDHFAALNNRRAKFHYK